MKGISKPLKYNNKARPEYKWRITMPGDNGTRIARVFRTKVEADAFYYQNAPQVEKAGLEVATLPAPERKEYIDAYKLLKPFGVSVIKAATIFAETMNELKPYNKTIPEILKHYKKYNDIKQKSISLQKAIDEYLESLENEGKGKRRCADQKNRLNRFKKDVGSSLTVSLISTAKCEKWISSLKVIKQTKKSDDSSLSELGAKKIYTKQALDNRTLINYRASIIAFFNFCIRRGYAQFNPASGIPVRKIRKDEPKFYSLDDIRSMLNKTEPMSEIRAYIAIAAFGGLRVAEIERLDWKNINLQSRIITLSSEITKTGQRRIVKISDNLALWLSDYVLNIQKGGPIISSNFRRHIESFREKNNIEWIHNGLRHSFGTYYYALSENEYETAKQMGNSPNVLKTHYAGLATKEEGQQYFDIKPKNSIEIIPVESALNKCV